MTDPLAELAALVRALDHRIVLYRNICDQQPGGTWRVTETLYRGWVAPAPAPQSKGEDPDV